MAWIIFAKKVGQHHLILERIWDRFHKEYRLRWVKPLLEEVKDGNKRRDKESNRRLR